MDPGLLKAGSSNPQCRGDCSPCFQSPPPQPVQSDPERAYGDFLKSLKQLKIPSSFSFLVRSSPFFCSPSPPTPQASWTEWDLGLAVEGTAARGWIENSSLSIPQAGTGKEKPCPSLLLLSMSPAEPSPWAEVRKSSASSPSRRQVGKCGVGWGGEGGSGGETAWL